VARSLRAGVFVALLGGGLWLPLRASHAQHAYRARSAAGPSTNPTAVNPTAVHHGGLPSEPRAPQERRRSNAGRIALQFVAAGAGAAGAGLGTYLILHDVGTKRVEGDAGYTRAGTTGYMVGSFAGATLGAHLVGTRMGGRSPLWATAVGALVGTVPLIAMGVDEPYLPLMGIAFGWIPQAALATIGFNIAESGSR
jgi:hypothetical protein